MENSGEYFGGTLLDSHLEEAIKGHGRVSLLL
jgi:hypothetical protein